MKKLLFITAFLLTAFAQAQNWQWAKSALGTGGDDVGNAITIAPSGDLFVTGNLQGPVTFDTITVNDGMFVAKYSSAGGVYWAKNSNGPMFEQGRAVVSDAQGNVYVSGGFRDTVDFGGVTVASLGGLDAFVAKYNSSGALQWVTTAGGTGWDRAGNIGRDSLGNLYISGYVTGTAYVGNDTLNAATSDVFVAKLDANGNYIWAYNMGGAQSDGANAMAVDSAGNTYLTGYFRDIATFGTYTLTTGADNNVFVTKVSPSGAVLWALQNTGTAGEYEFGNGISLDAAGNVYVCGSFGQTSSFGTYSVTSAGAADIFIAKFSPGGTPLWQERAGGTLYDMEGGEIVTDLNGNSYLSGSYNTSATVGSFTLTSAGANDVFVAKYNSSGAVLWATSAGGPLTEHANAITTDNNGNVYLTGYFDSTAVFAMDTLVNSELTPGEHDIFVAKLVDSNTTGVTKTIAAQDLAVYPNPGAGKFFVQSASKEGTLRVYNSIGTLVHSASTGHGGKATLDLTSMAPGVYLVQLDAPGKHETRKIIINK